MLSHSPRAAVLARARVALHRALAIVDLAFLAGRGDDARVRLGRLQAPAPNAVVADQRQTTRYGS